MNEKDVYKTAVFLLNLISKEAGITAPKIGMISVPAPFFRPWENKIFMWNLEKGEDPLYWYSTFLHEITHACSGSAFELENSALENYKDEINILTDIHDDHIFCQRYIEAKKILTVRKIYIAEQIISSEIKNWNKNLFQSKQPGFSVNPPLEVWLSIMMKQILEHFSFLILSGCIEIDESIRLLFRGTIKSMENIYSDIEFKNASSISGGAKKLSILLKELADKCVQEKPMLIPRIIDIHDFPSIYPEKNALMASIGNYYPHDFSDLLETNVPPEEKAREILKYIKGDQKKGGE